jgi:hypothetical protein
MTGAPACDPQSVVGSTAHVLAQNAGAACAALDDPECRLNLPTGRDLQLPLLSRARPQAAGRYKSYGVKIALDGCSLCGLGTQASP